MKLFINAGFGERKYIYKMKQLKNGDLKIRIPVYSEKAKTTTYLYFTLPDCTEQDLETDTLFPSILLKNDDVNAFHFKESKTKNENGIYALVRSMNAIPDDIYIPASMKHAITVIKRIRFVDDEVDFGDFLSNVYFIYIQLEENECLPLYLSYEEPFCLNKHYVFYKSEYTHSYHVTKQLETYLILTSKNRNNYISLSELCKLSSK